MSPLHDLESFAVALESLESQAWYLHRKEGRFYFDRQENLTKMLQSYADGASDNLIDELIRSRLKEMFKPIRKTVYEEVLPLPKLDEISDKVRKGRVLLVVSPDAKLPPEEVRKLFDSLMEKNHLCVLTGEKTQMASVEKAARQLFSAMKVADTRIPAGHPQRDELDKKRQIYEQGFTSTLLNLFDQILFPVQINGKPPQLRAKLLDSTRDQSKPFNGEDQIEKTLIKDPLKLYLDLEANFDAIKSKAEDLLWPENLNDVKWNDALERFSEEAGMPWLPPKGIEQIKNLACQRGFWEEIGNGCVTKMPQRKKTSVQWTEESCRDDQGFVRLRVNAQNGGPNPRIHYAEDGPVSSLSPILKEEVLKTKAVRVHFLVVDSSKRYESGDPQAWEGRPVVRNKLHESSQGRKVELFMVPNGSLKYTLDGSEPRNGTFYTEAIPIGNDEISLSIFADVQGMEAKATFKFAARGQKGPVIDDNKPANFHSKKNKQLDSRTKAFQGLKEAKEKKIKFENVTLVVGNGAKIATLFFGELSLTADYIERALTQLIEPFDSHTPVAMKFRKASFSSGFDLKQFCESMGLEIQMEEVIQ